MNSVETTPEVPGYSRLPAEAYFDEEFHQVELEKIFRTSWLMVASTTELRNDHDYIVREILGVPLLLWRQEGEIEAYVNICPHRQNTIASSDGHSKYVKCQYHGWEFQRGGRICRIPNAEAFAGTDRRNNFRLRSVRTGVAGSLIFVNFAEDAMSLEAYLGSRTFNKISSVSDYVPLMVREVELPCNWKLMLENSIDDYHTPVVHANSFGRANGLVPLTSFAYERNPNRLGCVMSIADTPQSVDWQAGWVALTTFAGMHVAMADDPRTVSIDQVTPSSRNRCVRKGWLLGHKSLYAHRERLTEFAQRVLDEDEALMPQLQKAKESPVTFANQLIGAAEARISYFHAYLMEVHASRGRWE